MKKLILIILLLPIFATAQINGTIQKTVATGTVRGNFGSSGLDTLVKSSGSLAQNITGKKSFLDSVRIGSNFSRPVNYKLYVSTPLELNPVAFERRLNPGSGLGRGMEIMWAPNTGTGMQVGDGVGYIFSGYDAAGTYTTHSSWEAPVQSVTANMMKGALESWFADGTNLKANPDYLTDHIPYSIMYPKQNGSTRFIHYGTSWRDGNYKSAAYGVRDSSSIYIDKDNYRIGINNWSPTVEFDVNGLGRFSRNSFSYVEANSVTSDAWYRLSYNGTKKWDLKVKTDESDILKWINASDANVMTLSQAGALSASGTVKATTFETYLLIPTGLAATGATTGGTLAAGTYFYKVTALNSNGETLPSSEVSVITTGTTSSVSLTWGAVTGATSYRIYRGTATNAQNVYYTSTTASYVDINAASTAGTVPTVNSANVIRVNSAGEITAMGTVTAPTFVGALSGNSSTATSLQTARTIGALTGDVTSAGSSFDGTGNNTNATVLATVNSNVGSFGSSTSIPSFTVNGKGLITAVSGNDVIAPAGTLSGTTLNSGVTASSLTSLGTITSLSTGSITNSGGLIFPEAGNGSFQVGRDASTPGFYIYNATAGSVGYSFTINKTSNVASFLVSPVAPTPAANDNSTKVATTAYVDGKVTSGTYTPTLTNGTNVASSTAYTWRYQRVGDQVFLSGSISITATTNAISTELGISLPISSNFTDSRNVSGAVVIVTDSNQTAPKARADTTNDRISFTLSAVNSAKEYDFSISYTVL